MTALQPFQPRKAWPIYVVNARESVRAIPEGQAVTVRASVLSAIGTIRSIVSCFNKKAGYEAYRCTSIDNGESYTLEHFAKPIE